MSDQAREPSQWVELVKYANSSPTLLSLLYDLDLMPEQLTTGHSDHAKMLCIIAHFRSAIDAATAQKDQEIARLKAEGHDQFREQNNCIRLLRDNLADADRAHFQCQERIAQLTALLEQVPHSILFCEAGVCIRCEYERGKS